MRRTLAISVLFVLAACGGGSGGSSEGPPSVPWGKDVDQAVKTRIDAAAKDKNCNLLQGEFDTADAGNNPSKANLLEYIDYRMKKAGCY